MQTLAGEACHNWKFFAQEPKGVLAQPMKSVKGDSVSGSVRCQAVQYWEELWNKLLTREIKPTRQAGYTVQQGHHCTGDSGRNCHDQVKQHIMAQASLVSVGHILSPLPSCPGIALSGAAVWMAVLRKIP